MVGDIRRKDVCDLIEKYEPDIVLIQETALKQHQATHDVLPGYTTYHDFCPQGTRAGKGVAIAIKINIGIPLGVLSNIVVGSK